MDRLADLLEKRVLGLLSLLIAVYHVLNVFVNFQAANTYYITHVGLALVFVCLVNMADRNRRKWSRFIIFLVALLSIVSIAYVEIHADRLEASFGFISNADFVVGILILIVVLFTSWISWGPVLPVLALIAIFGFFLTPYLPGVACYPPETIMSYLAVGMSTGVFGYMVPVSANFIFFFLLLGGLLSAAKVLDMFFEVGKAVANVVAAGPGITAVIASSLFGMVSGSSVANVTFTGSFTIPTMKKFGYPPHFAGAIESAASTGGQIMPPIMGATAFVMAAFVGIPYVAIMTKAIIPASLYYLCVFMSVTMLTLRYNLTAPKAKIDVWLILRQLPTFLLPLGVLIVLLFLRYSAMYCASYAIFTLLIVSFLQKQTRPSLKKLLEALTFGIKAGLQITVLLSLVGIIAQTIISLGVGMKLASAIRELTGGMLPFCLLITMFMCIILGIGVPTTAAYIMVSLAAVPVLLEFGVPIISAHFFAFYFAIFSTLTPPVAITSLAASRISGGKWMKTSLEAAKMGVIAWIIPYVLVTRPALMEIHPFSFESGVVIFSSLLTVVTLNIAVYGYFLGRISMHERVFVILSAIGSLVFLLLYDLPSTLVISLALFILFLTRRILLRGKKARYSENHLSAT